MTKQEEIKKAAKNILLHMRLTPELTPDDVVDKILTKRSELGAVIKVEYPECSMIEPLIDTEAN